ncbi:hypothetical protein VNI00_018923 [Paramarasmius palmivorus]|uniref:J domain-containing protein n=1 Tax=Paramarasmius palmivorus TaxID=297713 RepID=A0AAW0AT72_9AGAR
MHLRIPALLLLSLLTPFIHASSVDPPNLLPLTTRANHLLSLGQFNEAASVYTEAIQLSPSDYLLYYKRATAYLSLSRHGAALEDFDKVLELTNGTFDGAYLMKAKIHLKEGEYDLASGAVSEYFKSPSAGGSGAKATEAADLQSKIEDASKLYSKARKEHTSHLPTACVTTTSTLIHTYSPYSIPIRSLRAECSLLSGDVAGAVGDYTRLASLLPPEDAMKLHLVVFRLSYFFLPAPEEGVAALNPLKQCLHFDPDNKQCLSLHRIAKSFERSFSKLQGLLEKEDWRGAVALLTDAGKGKEKDLLKKFDEALESNTARAQLLPPTSASQEDIPLPDPKIASPRRQTLIRALCRAYTHLAESSSGSAYLRKTEMFCGELIGMEGCAEDVDGLVGKASVLLAKDEDEDVEEGVRVLERAFEATGRSNRDIHRKLSEAKKALKMRKRKDYYKVLGVSRDADEKSIKKAYRKAAKTAHPDKGGSEAKMAAVNEAYEVLSNPELRARFDAGDDPNDPTSQGGGPFQYHYGGGGGGGGFGGADHPFAQFFQQSPPGHHGGQQFKFHFG